MPLVSSVKPAQVTRTEDALRITLTMENDYQGWDDRPNLVGSIHVELPGWRREEWGDILIRARTSEKILEIGVGFNLRKELGPNPWDRHVFLFSSGEVPVIRDGSEQTYVMRADWSMDYSKQWEGPWNHLGIGVWGREPASIDILSVAVIPKEARYSDAPTGVRTESRSHSHRRTLFTHTPARIEYQVRVPEAAQLDFGLGVLREDVPTTFRVTAQPEGGVVELQHSVMGGMRNNRNAPPEEALTIPEHLHRAGYQTALFTSNPNAATMSGLDGGVDILREKSVDPTSVSTRELHADYWKWRREYSGEPYWVHFQTTDVHWPHNPPAPFSGLYIDPERRRALDEWESKLKGSGFRLDRRSEISLDGT